jgi:predicted permease
MMSWIQRMFRRRLQDDSAAEWREHVEQKTNHLIHAHEVWQWPHFESLLADARLAIRQLGRSPGIALVAVITLALGIGANTAIFTLTWNIVLRGLPVPHPEQLVAYEMRDGLNGTGLSGPLYTHLRQRQKTSVDIFAMANLFVSVRNGDHTTKQFVQTLSGNAFNVLGLEPALGRTFTEQDDKNQGAQGIPAVLSYEFWLSEFNGDPSVLGRALVIGDHPVIIAGVLPRAFDGPIANQHQAVYLPLSFAPFLFNNKNVLTQPGSMMLQAMGRLRPGVKLANAIAEARALEPSLRKAVDPGGLMLNGFFKNYRLQVEDGHGGIAHLKDRYGSPLFVLELLVAFLLVLCCVNTALVMLARVSGRQQEYALRTALGAGRLRLVRQVLLETFLLAIPGVLAGVSLGWYAARVLFGMITPSDEHIVADLHPNAIILIFNLVSTFLIVLGAGLVPALRAAKTAPAIDLKAADRSVAAKHLGGWAIALQITVSLCLVSTAFLLGGMLTSMLSQGSGFVTKNAAYAFIDLDDLKLDKVQTQNLYGRFVTTVESKPGVSAAGYTSVRPLTGSFGVTGMFSLDSEHRVHSEHNLFYTSATPGFFAAAGTRILSGTPGFAASSAIQQCVVSKVMASYFFPGENSIGQELHYTVEGKADGTDIDPKNVACVVVAIAEDVRYQSSRKPITHAVYLMGNPEQQQSSYNNLCVRAGSADLAVAAIHQAAKEVIPPGAEITVSPFTDLADFDLNRERMLVSLSGSFALLALLLTALGLYGLLMRSVNLRTREIGIRVALGAQRKAILVALGKRAFLEVLIGLAAGTVVAMLLNRVIHRILSLPGGTGVAGYLLAILLILSVAALAVLAPARRASKVDPMQGLRAE